MTGAGFDIAIDVSHHQGAIDWLRVREAGILIAMIKATEGATFVDPRFFAANRAQAVHAGIAVIPYHFLRPGRVAEQVKHFANVIGLAPGAPYALDWEGRASETATALEVAAIGAMLADIAGRPPLGYWGIPGSTPAAPEGAMFTWPRWVPRYPTRGAAAWAKVDAQYRDHCGAWWKTGAPFARPLFAQYTDTGRVDGIVSLVDRSVAFFDSEAAALAWCRGEAAAPTVATGDRRELLEDVIADLRRAQERLKKLKIYTGDIDGKFGKDSSAAAMAAWRELKAAGGV